MWSLSPRVARPQEWAILPEERLRQDARALQDAGTFAVILTGISPDLAKSITEELPIPTISDFGAGR
jgi:ketopantoate hydroxymethyltransferase